jgi:hypothetical protein
LNEIRLDSFDCGSKVNPPEEKRRPFDRKSAASAEEIKAAASKVAFDGSKGRRTNGRAREPRAALLRQKLGSLRPSEEKIDADFVDFQAFALEGVSSENILLPLATLTSRKFAERKASELA